MAASRSPKGATAEQILDAAERLTQTRGFNGFSYADISELVGVTKASLHYHFRTKAQLGRQLLERYSADFEAALQDIWDSTPLGHRRLELYTDLYAAVLRGNRMCLCGMLAAEVTTLPEEMGDEIRRFFDLNERWLASVFEHGRVTGDIAFTGTPTDVARLFLSALEGAMLVARSYGDAARFEQSARQLLGSFAPAHAAGS